MPLRMDEQTAAHLADMLVERRLECDVTQLASGEPIGRELLHLRHDFEGIDVRRSEQLERSGGTPALAERSALEHDGPGISARHVEVRRIRAGIDPDALGRPAEARRQAWTPAFHLDDPIIDVE